MFLICSTIDQKLNTPGKKDEIAFPVRVRLKISANGFGSCLNDLHIWLNNEVGPGEYAVHSSPGLAMDAVGVYLRDVKCARQMLRAFPDLALADGTGSRVYSSPAHDGTLEGWELFGVCNLYSLTKGQAAIRALFGNVDDQTGNLPPLPGIYPAFQAPVVWHNGDRNVLSMMRWGDAFTRVCLKGQEN